MSSIDFFQSINYDISMDNEVQKLLVYTVEHFENCRITLGYDTDCDLFEIEIIDDKDIPIYVALGRTIEEAIQELYEKLED